jgi:hypothetical protein
VKLPRQDRRAQPFRLPAGRNPQAVVDHHRPAIQQADHPHAMVGVTLGLIDLQVQAAFQHANLDHGVGGRAGQPRVFSRAELPAEQPAGDPLGLGPFAVVEANSRPVAFIGATPAHPAGEPAR